MGDSKPGNTVTLPSPARHLLQFWCSDCTSPPALLWWSAAERQWNADLDHDPDCPVLRLASLRQAVNLDLAEAVGGLIALSDYGDDLLVRHHPLAATT